MDKTCYGQAAFLIKFQHKGCDEECGESKFSWHHYCPLDGQFVGIWISRYINIALAHQGYNTFFQTRMPSSYIQSGSKSIFDFFGPVEKFQKVDKFCQLSVIIMIIFWVMSACRLGFPFVHQDGGSISANESWYFMVKKE